MKKAKRIKIIRADSVYWYRMFIGVVFEVIAQDTIACLVKVGNSHAGVLSSDYEVVEYEGSKDNYRACETEEEVLSLLGTKIILKKQGLSVYTIMAEKGNTGHVLLGQEVIEAGRKESYKNIFEQYKTYPDGEPVGVKL